MRKRLFIAGGVLALLLIALLLARRAAAERLQTRFLIPRAQGAKTPGSWGVSYEAVEFDSGGRKLQAFWVAPPPGGPSLLVFHGNGESISSWAPVQKLLFDHGVGSMVFDYSGFGRSQGPARTDLLVEDGVAAWRAFRSRTPPGARACAYGLSLGSGVLLEAAPRLTPKPDCLAIWGGFTSALGAAVRLNKLPALLAPLLPDLLDNVKNAARAPAPLLVEHGADDQLFPPEDARAIAAAAPGARLLIVPGQDHAQPLVKPSEEAWVPVVALVRGVPESQVAPVVPPVRGGEAPLLPAAPGKKVATGP